MNWLLQIFDPATIGTLFAQFQSEMQQPAFWVAVGKIIWINVLLSGDNALVIALACRGLEPRQRLWGMILGAGAAVFLRIIFTGIVVSLMELPYPQAGRRAGAARDRRETAGAGTARTRSGVESASHLWAAVQIVVVADIVMSLDNVIAVAAAANGSVPLLVLGLAISVPLIVAGAALIMALLDADADFGMGGRGPAGLDRRRRDGDRSRDSSETATAFRRPVGVECSTPCWRRSEWTPRLQWRAGAEIASRGAGRDRRAGGGIDLATSAGCSASNARRPSTERSRRSASSASRSIRSGRPAAPAA